MKKNLKWYILLILVSIFLLGYIIFFIDGSFFEEPARDSADDLDEQEIRTEETETMTEKQNELPIPPLLEDENPEEGKAEFTLDVKRGQTEFIEGYETETLGYNGNYLGPVIQVNRGDDVKINVNNTLEEATTVHWHGLKVEREMDGGPHQDIQPHSEWTPEFTIDQPAATLWYHPHLIDTTGEQVYKGLAGLFYIEDDDSESLNIPKEYGVNDIPLVVQDKRFTENGQIPYQLSMRDRMDGFKGNTVLINGAITPELDVNNEVIRFRILNGSNARTYEFNFEDGKEFHQIASDGGFLEESVAMDRLVLAPAERAEILVDLSDYEPGEQLYFRDVNNELMAINITGEGDGIDEVPQNLVEMENYNREEALRTREFVMSGSGPMVAINGKQMDMDRIDEEINLDELEEWIVTNDPSGGMGGMMGRMHSSPHPFHVHGAQFQIIERDGSAPPENERGWKDTVMVNEGEKVRLLVKFERKGLFMYHCHILEHDDAGMMGQFIVE